LCRSSILIILCAEDISCSYTSSCKHLCGLKTPSNTEATASDHIDAAADYEITLDSLGKDRRERIRRRIDWVTGTVDDLRRYTTIVHRYLGLEARRILTVRYPLAINIVLRRTDDTIESLTDTLL
jgi:hypothetical protein